MSILGDNSEKSPCHQGSIPTDRVLSWIWSLKGRRALSKLAQKVCDTFRIFRLLLNICHLVECTCLKIDKFNFNFI